MSSNSQSSALESRLDRIEQSLLRIQQMMDQAPTMVAIAADTVDDELATAREHGIDVEGRFKSMIELLKRLSDPGVMQTLRQILDLADQGPGLVAMAADMVDDTIAKGNSGAVRLDDRIQALTSLMNKLSDPAFVHQVEKIVDLSGQLPGIVGMAMDSMDEVMTVTNFDVVKNLNLLQTVLAANYEALNTPAPKIGGLFSMLRMMKDPHVNRAMGFLLNFMKSFGKHL